METVINSFRGEYFFLSNFYRCDVDYLGVIYPTAEHAFQAAKCANVDEMELIQFAPNPRVAKQIGRRVKLVPGWNEARKDVMFEILKSKFEEPELRNQLLDTGNAELIEGNTWGDTFWGICRGRGFNHLGKMLMTIRKDIIENDN